MAELNQQSAEVTKRILFPMLSSLAVMAVIQLGTFLYQNGRTSNILDDHGKRITKVEDDVKKLSEQSDRLVRLEVRGENMERQVFEVKTLLMGINERMLSESKPKK